MKKVHHNQKGFSLMEIVLSLLVVSVGIVALLGLLGTSLSSTGKSHSDITCVSFADMVLNWCHAETNWNSIPVSGGLTLKDYQEETHTLVYNKPAPFTCLLPGSDGSSDMETFTITYELQVEEQQSIKKINLKVWPGYSTNQSAHLFYTELFNRFKI